MRRQAIDRVRESLAFSAREEALVREAAPRLAAEVPRWVDEFYARLIVDPVAMALLKDEASIIRLKRSLNAWFLELFSLPYDAAYERARATIGRTHVRIGMPQHLMVTAMGGMRRDLHASVARLWADDPETGRRVATAIEKMLDLELALMLEQFARRSREVARDVDRSDFARHEARRVVEVVRGAVDAALCYAELLRVARDDGERDRYAERLGDALKEIARLGDRTPREAKEARDGDLAGDPGRTAP